MRAPTHDERKSGLQRLAAEFGLTRAKTAERRQRSRCRAGCGGYLYRSSADNAGRTEKEWPHEVWGCDRCGSHIHLTPAGLVRQKAA